LFFIKFEKQELKKIIKYTPPHHSFNDKLVDDAQLRGVRDMVLKTTFTNISVISRWSVLLVRETGISRENHRPAASH
jgi:hypothetical protein